MTISSVEHHNHEMSRLIPIGKIGSTGMVEKAFKATDLECVSLTERLGIIAVEYFEGTVQMVYLKREQAFSISGTFKAKVTQECRTTFKPLTQEIEETFKELLVTKRENLPSPEEALESDDVIELLDGDEIDYGEIAVQWLSLSLDPYPRAEGEVFEHVEHKPTETNPFASLKSLNLQNNEKK